MGVGEKERMEDEEGKKKEERARDGKSPAERMIWR
jgi:hypothetical protein